MVRHLEVGVKMDNKTNTMQIKQARRRMYSTFSKMRRMLWKLNMYQCTIEEYESVCDEYRQATEDYLQLTKED